MSQQQGPLYHVLKWIAIAGAVAWLGYEGYRHFVGMEPGDVLYIDGNNLFKDGHYARASEYFKDALEENPKHGAAIRGLSNSYVQLKRYDDALRTIDKAIVLDPNFAGNYALRGIIYDHMGEHKLAMADYEKSLVMDPEIADGMHWLDRLLYNVQERPPTVKDRLEYLQKQFELPPEKRVLSDPEKDTKQRPYEQ